MDSHAIRAKFGLDYVATERTFVMGIDQRFTKKIAERFRNRRVLETCSGGGFTTVALARVAAHVITVEIDPTHHAQAKQNGATAGLLDRVTFVRADIMEEEIWGSSARFRRLSLYRNRQSTISKTISGQLEVVEWSARPLIESPAARPTPKDGVTEISRAIQVPDSGRLAMRADHEQPVGAS